MFAYNSYYGKVFVTDNVIMVKENQSVQKVLDSITDAAEENQFVVFLPPRVYLLDEPLVCKEWIHLVCPVPYGAILRPTFEANHKLIKFASNIYVHGIYMDAEYKTLGSLIPKDAHDIAIRNCLFQRNKAATGCTVHGYNVLFENCIARYSHGDDGFSVEESWDAELGDYRYGHNVTYINCKSYDNYQEPSGTMNGFEVEDGCYDITYINCEAWNNQGGLEIHSHHDMKPCYNITIIGGKFSFIGTYHVDRKRHKNIKIIKAVASRFGLLDLEDSDINIIHRYLNFDGKEHQTLPEDYMGRYNNILNSKIKINSSGNQIHNYEASPENAYIINSSIKIDYFAYGGKNGMSPLQPQFHKDSELKLNIYRPSIRPQTTLASDVASGSTEITVSDTSNFRLYSCIKIGNSNTSEYNYIMDINEDVITLQNPLTNDYTVAENTVIEEPYCRFMSLKDSENTKVHISFSGTDPYLNLSNINGCSCSQLDKIYVQTLYRDLNYIWLNGDVLFLNPNGSDRNITLSSACPVFPGWKFTIINTGTTGNLIFDPSGLNLSIQPGQSANVIYDGDQWRQI